MHLPRLATLVIYRSEFDCIVIEIEFPKESPLSQSVERDGRSVSVEIYDDGAGKWLLEVVDEFNNSTVWEDVFDTDDMALKEALDTIEEEGIQALIGSPPDTV